jgi:uncharacterized protein (DUF2235 family)
MIRNWRCRIHRTIWEGWIVKNIIFCADGTWNSPKGKTSISPLSGADNGDELTTAGITNVVKLFANLAGNVTSETLALHNEQEKIFVDNLGNIKQVTKYIHGVGDSSNPLIKLLGGVLGMGVIERIVRGYTFISRNYVPGDLIHIVGFSRGAYTARALAGMITKVGLLNPQTYDPSDKMEAYRLGIAAWAKSKSISLQGADKLTELAQHMLNFVEGFIAKQLPDNGLVPNVPVKSVAVWDTVGSMGIPEYVGDKRFDVFRFVDTKLSDKVEYGFHAMAIDEMRRDFPVTKWDDRQKIEQVWFVGGHSDVGGGYPTAESRLSDEALGWMMKKLSGVGVDLATPPAKCPECEVLGQSIHKPWEELPFSTFPTDARQVGANDTLHVSVVQRWNGDATYRPQAMTSFAAQGLGKCKVDEAVFS